MTYPLKVMSHYSIQEAFLKIPDLVKFAAEHNFPAVAVIDLCTLSGIPEFLQELEKVNKKRENKIIPIVGMTFDVLNDTEMVRYIAIAKNKAGWYALVSIHNSLHQGCLTIEQLTTYVNNENLFVFKNEDIDEDFAYYSQPSDHICQQIVICSKHKITIKDANNVLKETPYYKFFDNKLFALQDAYPANELKEKILKSIEVFSLSDKPHVPVFIKDNPDEVLRELCRIGWKDKQIQQKCNSSQKLYQRYTDRIKEELRVLTEYNLSNYMLIIKDIVDYCKSNHVLCGFRGSASGCLVSYLIGMSNIDPVWPDYTLPYDESKELIFARFLNEGRLGTGSLPDVDLDLDIFFRDQLIEYIKTKYGEDNVSYINTFQTMDGRQAVKEVFRILEPVSYAFELADEITKKMLDTAKIQDELEDLKDEKGPQYNVVNFNIDNVPQVAAYYNDYKEYFDIAIKLAGTIRSRGRHAAGIVITDQPIASLFPIINDGEHKILAFEMVDAEYVGAVKFDLLGVAALSKISTIVDMITSGARMPNIGTIENVHNF